MPKFLFATHESVAEGRTTDVYFIRTRRILEAEGLADAVVYAEFSISGMPEDAPWIVLGGLRDVLRLLEGRGVDVYAPREGTVLFERDFYGVKEPIMAIVGPYREFVELETPILGFLGMGSGIATKAARVKRAAGDKPVLSFGARRTHPAIAPFNGFYAYIGGCDAVSCIEAADLLGIRPTGTMPHSLVILFKTLRGRQEDAWRAFDRHVGPEVRRILLVDTYCDEVQEAVRAVEAVGPEKVWGVRLDTPGSRRGDFPHIVREVKWALRVHGYGHVKVVVSGGIDEKAIPRLAEAGADAFGVGSAIANARIVDVAMDITAVLKDGRWVPAAKRGKFTGRKQLYRCEKCFVDVVAPLGEQPPVCPRCGGAMTPLLEKVVEKGKVVREPEPPGRTREYVLRQVSRLELDRKPWE